MPGVDIALQPVVRSTVVIPFHGLHILGFFPVELGTFSQYFIDTEHLGAMGIVRGFALGVVFTVYCRPFLCNHAGSKPQPEAKKMAGQGMQLQRAVSLMAMEIYCYACDGYMGEAKSDRDITPPR